jgi:uncharacterized MAPEG superfamily protein
MGSPTADEWNQLFRVYAVCTLFLWVKYTVTALYALDQNNHFEGKRVNRVIWGPYFTTVFVFLAEDKLFGDVRNPDNIKRRVRVFANDLENIPFHTAVFWAAFVVRCFANMSGSGQNETLALTAFIIMYCCFRMAHTGFYLNALSPHRSIAFVLSNFCVGGAALVMVNSAFDVDGGSFV